MASTRAPTRFKIGPMSKTMVISHAAAAGEAPANTLAGVRAALVSADAMEVDVQLSRDGVPVLMHDNTVDRTTNFSGAVSEFTAEELATADAGEGEHVPRLAEVLDLVQGRLAVFCELKATPDDAGQDGRLVDAVLNVVGRHDASAWCGIHSFEPVIVERCRETQPRIATALISGPAKEGEIQRLFTAAIKRGSQAVSVHYSSVDREFVRAAKARMLTVACWTANEEADWRRLIDAGVDGIVTDYPARLREMLTR